MLCLGSAGRIGGMSVVIWWRLGGVSVMSWCNPRSVSVFIAQVRLGGAWAGMYVRHVVSASYFIGVAVSFKPYFWYLLVVYARSLACGCLAGVGMAFFGCESAACELLYGVHIRYFNRVLHLRARTRYTTSNNPARLWPMTSPAFSCPYRRSYIGKRQLAWRVIK